MGRKKNPMYDEIQCNLQSPPLRLFRGTVEEITNAVLRHVSPEQCLGIIKMAMDDLVDDTKWTDNAIEAIRSKIDEQ